MKKDDIHRYFLKTLENHIPEKIKLVEMLMETLCMEKGAIYRRLRGDVPFSFLEVMCISEKLGISLNNFSYTDSVNTEHFELKIVEYTNMIEADYKQLEDIIFMISLAKDDAHSEIAESSNILPLSIYGGFDSLSKYFLFKYQYLFNGTENRISFSELNVPERLISIYRSYFTESKNFAKTIYLWDHLIFQYLVNDIHFYSSINLISEDYIQLIKQDLFSLLDYIEDITLNGCFRETGNTVFFYISDINLEADYSYWQLNDLNLSFVRTFILNAVTSTDKTSFGKIKDWIHSLKKSSTLISKSGTIYRMDFIEKQRMIISEL